ncbi:MAG TPA: murein biosynthesis integral membrane protein MurJ [Chloroflexia bacterium]|nr:murein biosynthesis integral membrane protein MurJ [Chloroflexia bacterium]
MLPNTDITLQDPEAEAAELLLEAEGASAAREEERRASASGRIAGAALILMAGTILSRVLGVGRESTIAFLFGVGADVDAFTVANHVATIVFDLLISGTVSAALVPVFSEYAGREDKRAEFGKIVGTVLTVSAIFLVLAVAVLELFAVPLVGFMSQGFDPATQSVALTMTQVVLPGVIFMGLSGVVMAVHYSLNRFIYPAFTSALFNAAIIFCAFSLFSMGVSSLAIGLVVGSIAMLALQLPGLRDLQIRPSLDLRHPAVRKIFKLYAPVGLSMVVSSTALVIDRNLASQVGEGAISAMRYATTLVQLALGIVAAGISLASLPSLSQHFSHGDTQAYRRTLAAGLRMVTLLVLPAAAGLLALSSPLVSLIFRHGRFTAEDQALVVLALLFYIPGLPFSAIDQVLIIAFYARKNTLTPVLIGIAAAGVYLAVAFATVDTMGMTGLVLANSAQLTFHAIVTGLLLWRALRSEGGLGGHGIAEVAFKALGASVLMAVVSWGVWWGVDRLLHNGAPSPAIMGRPPLQAPPLIVVPAPPPGPSLLEEVITLGVPALIGGIVYITIIWLMRLPEAQMIANKVRSRLKR